MIIWINGAFGVGKTTTSAGVAAVLAGYRHFDPEWVGYMLANNLADQQVTDFQHYVSWRRLVPVVADEIIKVTDQGLVAAQSVLVEAYWRELQTGLVALGHEVFQVLLDADAETLHARIDADVDEPARIRPWRHRHVGDFEAARSWLIDSADLVVDTAALDAAATIRCVESALTAQTCR